SFARLAEVCKKAQVPLVVDAAHGHYLRGLVDETYADLAYSFYATKILPAGEGGLVATADSAVYEWVRRFLMYDRFENQLQVGLQLGAGELGAAVDHWLMTDTMLLDHFKTARIEVANRFISICKERSVRFLDPAMAAEYNGYKLVILDRLEDVATLKTRLT